MNRVFILITLLVALLTAAVQSHAATYSVQATAVEAITAEPLAGASFAIYSAKDSVTPVAAGMTDATGTINQSLAAAGNYTLRISFTGMEEARRIFTVNQEKPDALLGIIAMQPSEQALKEVVVTGRRPVIETAGDKVSYNMDEDPTSQTSSVLEMLRKVPMVTVDGQDNIYINGQQNFKIYLNGKEDPMLSQNASMVLKNLPASSIVKVEVILEPGAKYDAEGVGGILNIVTVGKRSAEGYLTTITAGISNTHANAGVYARTKVRNVTASVDVSYNNTAIGSHIKSDGDLDRYTTLPDGSQSLNKLHIVSTGRNQFLSGTFQLSWEPDTLNLFTLSANGFGAWGTQWSNTLSEFYPQAANPVMQWSNRQHMRNDWTWSTLTVNAGYQHNFDMKGHNIVLSYQYVRGWDSNKRWQTYSDFIGIDMENPLTYDYLNSPTNEHTVQLDYTNPLSKILLLETGAKGIFRRNSSDGYTLDGSSWDNLQNTGTNTVQLSQYQDVAAIYASLSANYKSLSVKGGLRYEYTHMGVRFHTPGYENFSSNLNDLVPNGSISYSFAPGRTLHASYQMRIRRPGVDELNPHRSELFTNIVSAGNPDLTSEINHSLALQYSNFAGVLGWNLRASYSFSDNQIDQFITAEGNQMLMTYLNSGSQKRAGLSGYMRYAPNQKFNCSLNASANYSYFSFKGQDITNHGWTYYLGGDVNYTLPWAIQTNLYGGWSTRSVALQGWRSGFYYYGLSLTRAFLRDDKLKITVSATNFATPKYSFKQYMHSPETTMALNIHVPVWRVGLSVSYTLGSLSSDVKRTSSVIENNDVEVNKKN